MLLFRQPCVQFGSQATRPLKDYPRNNEIFLWPESWRGSLHIYLLSFPRFWTLSIKGFCFLFWSILNGVTLKTSNMAVTGEKTLFSPATTILETRRHQGRGCGKPVVSTLLQKTAEADTWPNFHTIQFSRKQKKNGKSISK